VVAVGSSERQLPAKGSVKLVLTDPPYHDDLQYGELARVFHAWLKVADGTEMPSEKLEAVPNNVRGTDTDHFRSVISKCLSESQRTLAPDGRLVLTFHNKDVSAWESLADALHTAELFVVGIATVSAENSADHSKRDKLTFLCDLVIECIPRRPGRRAPKLVISGRKRGAERRNLLEMGKALAARVNTSSEQNVSAQFQERMAALNKVPVLIS
jgi:adenine-specific DNA methylase